MNQSNSYTKLPNEIMEYLMSSQLTSADKSVLTYIARQTYGFHRATTRISNRQFKEKLGLSHRKVIYSLQRLQELNFIDLINKGNSRLFFSEWKINLTNKLVHKNAPVHKSAPVKLVHNRAHTSAQVTHGTMPVKKHIKESLALLLGNSYKYENNKHFRRISKGWIEIKYPTSYLNTIGNTIKPESPEKGENWINAKDLITNTRN